MDFFLFSRSNSYATEDQSDALRNRVDFHTYILQTCLQLFLQIKSMKDHELKNYLELNKQNLVTIGE